MNEKGRVAHFCGRMFFEEHGEIALRSAVEKCLADNNVIAGYGALACGADIIIAEALLARGAELHVVLPYEADQ